MWDKLDIFGWNKKKPTPQPVQKEISINITNGDRRETVQRSPSGTKMASSTIAKMKNRLDDDESSDGSTSINFGLKVGPVPRRGSFSFSREAMDLPTWSNVTSPGFTSRLVQQASGHSPLKEFNDSLSNSPFRKSPYKDLSLGELPFVNYSKSRASSPPAFPTPNRLLKPGVTSSIYNRDRRRNARQGQVFVRIAPIDPTVKANISINRKASTPPVGPYPPRGSPRAGEAYRPDGLGGIPQQELSMRFNRMWPNSPPGSPVPGPGRPLSPTAPPNLMEALVSGRKRVRDHETYYPGPPNATPPSVSPPSKISIGIGDTPVRPHPMSTKRVKFGLNTSEGHDRPMVPYPGMGGNDHEPLSSESILEQMNQTERRFLPDSTSTPSSYYKKPIRMSEEPQPSTSASMRKRRHQNNIINTNDEESKGEKVGRYCCPCNECYAEAIGNNSFNLSGIRDGSASPNKSSSEESSPSKNSTSMRSTTCDVGVGTDNDRVAYFKELFRKADRRKKTETDEENADIMKLGKTVVTKEMYERDKLKRVERYFRLQNMKMPGPGEAIYENPADQLKCLNGKGNGTTATNGVSNEPASTTSANGNPGFSFGTPATTSNSGGFSFGKQTSPVAQTMTTNACPTITSSSITGSVFSGQSSTAPSRDTVSSGATTPASIGASGLASLPVSSNLFGSSTTPAPAASNASLTLGSVTSPAGTSNPATTSSTPSISFGTGSSTPSVNFGTGSNTLAQPKPKETPTLTTSSSGGGFSFSGAAASTPPFGFGGASNSNSSTTTTTASLVTPAPSASTPATTATATFGGFGTSTSSAVPSFGSSATSGGGFSFGQNTQSSQPSEAAAKAQATTSQVTQPSTTTTSIFGSLSATPSATTSSEQASQPGLANKGFSFGQATGSSGGFSFAASKPVATEDKTDSKGNETATTTTTVAPGLGGSSGGFSFGGASSTGGFSFSKPTAQPSTTTANTMPSTTTSNIFGGLAPAGAGPTASTTTSLFSTPSTTGGTVGNSAASSSQSGNIFGGLNNPGSTVTTTNSGFGLGTTTTALSTTTSTQPAMTFGSVPSFSAGSAPGVVNFGSGTKPNETQPTTTTASSGGFSFGGGSTSPPTFSGFGATPSTTSQTPAPTGNTFGSFRPNFPNVPNPLANKGTASGTTSPSFGGFGVSPPPTTTAAAPSSAPTFSSFGGAASPPAFGSGSSNLGGAQGGFSFGQNTLSPPSQTQPLSSGGFGFGSQVQSTPTPQQPTTGFAFGQTNPVAAPAPQPQPSPGVFQFGQQQQSPSPAPFQFGQQAAQGVPGGFNFAAAAPPGGQPMFNLGSSASTLPRRRDVHARRRHR